MGSVTQGTRFSWKRQTDWDTVASGSGSTNARITGETLTPGLTTTASDVLTADGQTVSQIRTDASGGGDVSGELMYGEWDDWFRSSLLSNDWDGSSATISITTATVTAGAAGVPNTLTADAADNFVAAGFRKGMWCKISGLDTPADNTIYKIIDFGTGGGTNDIVYLAGRTMTTDGTIAGPVTVTGLAEVCNGVQTGAYTVEIEDTDDGSSNEVRYYSKVTPTGCRIDFPQDGKATVTFTTTSPVPSQQGSATLTPAGTQGTSEPMIGGDIFYFREGDPEVDTIVSNGLLYDFTDFSVFGGSIEWQNSLRPRRKWGTVGPSIEPGRGDIVATANVQLYYNQSATAGRDDQALVTKAINDTLTACVIGIKDSSNQFYLFEIAAAKIASIETNSPAKNQDVIADVSFAGQRALLDKNQNTATDSQVVGTTIRIVRGTLPS